MHKVEWGLRQVIFDDVVLQDLKVGQRQCPQMPDVYIGSNDLPTGADPVGQPSRDRTAAGGNFQASPVVHRAERLHVAFCSSVENRGQRIEEASGLALSRT